MQKEMKPGRKYFIINIDEPYAMSIYEIMKIGQTAKGEWPEGDIPFTEWAQQTFNEPDLMCDPVSCTCETCGNSGGKAPGWESCPIHRKE